jgi:hypothetical protein
MSDTIATVQHVLRRLDQQMTASGMTFPPEMREAVESLSTVDNVLALPQDRVDLLYGLLFSVLATEDAFPDDPPAFGPEARGHLEMAFMRLSQRASNTAAIGALAVWSEVAP